MYNWASFQKSPRELVGWLVGMMVVVVVMMMMMTMMTMTDEGLCEREQVVRGEI